MDKGCSIGFQVSLHTAHMTAIHNEMTSSLHVELCSIDLYTLHSPSLGTQRVSRLNHLFIHLSNISK